MTTIVLMRHGKVENPKQILYGSLKGFHLSESGKEHVLAAALQMKSQGFVFERIISSPLLRARETSEIIAEEFGLHVYYDDRLREWGMGTWPGQPLQKFYSDGPYGKEPIVLDKDMETYDDAAERVLACIHETVKTFAGKHVLFVGHREPLVCAMLRLQGKTWESMHEFYLPNSFYWKLEFSDTGEFVRLEKGE